MGRKKIKIKRIEEPALRSLTFNRRKVGLTKKAMELSILCDADVALLVFGESGDLYLYSSKPFEEVMNKFSDYDGDMLVLRNSDHPKMISGIASSFTVGEIQAKSRIDPLYPKAKADRVNSDLQPHSHPQFLRRVPNLIHPAMDTSPSSSLSSRLSSCLKNEALRHNPASSSVGSNRRQNLQFPYNSSNTNSADTATGGGNGIGGLFSGGSPRSSSVAIPSAMPFGNRNIDNTLRILESSMTTLPLPDGSLPRSSSLLNDAQLLQQCRFSDKDKFPFRRNRKISSETVLKTALNKSNATSSKTPQSAFSGRSNNNCTANSSNVKRSKYRKRPLQTSSVLNSSNSKMDDSDLNGNGCSSELPEARRRKISQSSSSSSSSNNSNKIDGHQSQAHMQTALGTATIRPCTRGATTTAATNGFCSVDEKNGSSAACDSEKMEGELSGGSGNSRGNIDSKTQRSGLESMKFANQQRNHCVQSRFLLGGRTFPYYDWNPYIPMPAQYPTFYPGFTPEGIQKQSALSLAQSEALFNSAMGARNQVFSHLSSKGPATTGGGESPAVPAGSTSSGGESILPMHSGCHHGSSMHRQIGVGASTCGTITPNASSSGAYSPRTVMKKEKVDSSALSTTNLDYACSSSSALISGCTLDPPRHHIPRLSLPESLSSAHHRMRPHGTSKEIAATATAAVGTLQQQQQRLLISMSGSRSNHGLSPTQRPRISVAPILIPTNSIPEEVSPMRSTTPIVSSTERNSPRERSATPFERAHDEYPLGEPAQPFL